MLRCQIAVLTTIGLNRNFKTNAKLTEKNAHKSHASTSYCNSPKRRICNEYLKSLSDQSLHAPHGRWQSFQAAGQKAYASTMGIGDASPKIYGGWLYGATENARPDIARPSKLWRLTSRDLTKRHHIARVDIATRETWLIVRVEAHYKLMC